jgi:hypothetical protein
MIEVAHQRRSRLPVGDVLGRASHVDVDDFGAGAFGNARALRHPVRLAAGELNDMDAGALAFGAQHGVAAAFDQRIACRREQRQAAGHQVRRQGGHTPTSARASPDSALQRCRCIMQIPQVRRFR